MEADALESSSSILYLAERIWIMAAGHPRRIRITLERNNWGAPSMPDNRLLLLLLLIHLNGFTTTMRMKLKWQSSQIISSTSVVSVICVYWLGRREGIPVRLTQLKADPFFPIYIAVFYSKLGAEHWTTKDSGAGKGSWRQSLVITLWVIIIIIIMD